MEEPTPSSKPFLDHPGPIPFAHRGGAGDWPENTMPAFEGAVALGYRYVETDVHVTSDGVLLAFHDDRLDRVTDASGVVLDLPWSARRQGPGGRSRADPPAGGPAGHVARPPRQHRPQARRRRRTAGGGDPRHRRHRPRLRGFVLRSEDRPAQGHARHEAVHGDGPGRRGPAPGRQLRLAPHPGTGLRPGAHRGRDASRSSTSDSSARPIDSACRSTSGRSTTPTTMDRLLDLGVDGLMTDRPAVLKEVLQRRAAWFGA